MSHEGSVIISCATSIDLNLIQPNRDLDVVQEEGSLIYSKADMPVKQKNKKNSRDEHSHTVVFRVQKIDVNQCVNHKLQAKCKQQQCQVQAEKSVVMWPRKPRKDMQLNIPAMLIKHKMLKKTEDNKNCQENINRRPLKSKMCSDKKC